MRAEDATIGVDLVQDNKGEILKEPLPALVMSQNTPVQHIGIGKKDLGYVCPDLLSPVWGGVPIINLGRDLCPFDTL
jgi:hypothetical protein